VRGGGHYHHIFNRGVDKRQIFRRNEIITSLYHFKKRWLSGSTSPIGAVEPLNKPLIDILAYCLNPNHYHLLLRQNIESGISEFMKRIGAGYTYYFNNKRKRSGSLFQGKYKLKPIKSTEELLKLSVYVNCNAEIHGINKSSNWIWSSYLDYIGMRKGTLCNKKDIYEELNPSSQLSAPSTPAGALGALSQPWLSSQYKRLCKLWIEDSKRNAILFRGLYFFLYRISLWKT